jgi:guanylate kinase
MMDAPKLSESERKQYLAAAAAARAERAQLKRDVAAGKAKASAIVAENDDSKTTIGRMRVAELLRAVPGLGKARVETIMADLGIADNRRLGGLGKNQRAALADLLASREDE